MAQVTANIPLLHSTDCRLLFSTMPSATLWRPIFASSYLSSHLWLEAAKLLCSQHLGLFTSAWNKGHLQLLHHCIKFLTLDSQVSIFESDKWYLLSPQSTHWTADAFLESLSDCIFFFLELFVRWPAGTKRTICVIYCSFSVVSCCTHVIFSVNKVVGSR